MLVQRLGDVVGETVGRIVAAEHHLAVAADRGDLTIHAPEIIVWEVDALHRPVRHLVQKILGQLEKLQVGQLGDLVHQIRFDVVGHDGVGVDIDVIVLHPQGRRVVTGGRRCPGSRTTTAGWGGANQAAPGLQRLFADAVIRKNRVAFRTVRVDAHRHPLRLDVGKVRHTG